MKKLEFHEIANAFPLMEGDEFSELRADVKEHGVREQGVMLDGKILDGRNRYRAALAAKVYMPFRNFDPRIDGESAMAFVVSANLRRRHLDPSQRAMAAAKIANLENGRPKKTASIEAVSQEDAAHSFGVSRSAVQRAATVLENASAAVIHAVESGDVAVADAASVAELPKSEQTAALKKLEAGKAKTLKQAAAPKKKQEVDNPRPSGKQSTDPRLWEQWDDLFGKLKRHTDKLNERGSGEKFCRQIQEALNQAFAVRKDWKRSLR